MGLDNYWRFDLDDITGVEQGDEFEYELPTPEDEPPQFDTYRVEEEDDSISARFAAEAGSPDVPTFDRTFHLTGGMLSGNGPYSFRGKVYDTFVKDITGVSLYQDRIDNKTVKRMADELERTSWDVIGPKYHGGYDGFHSEQEFDDFCEMFRTFADAGAWLHGWW